MASCAVQLIILFIITISICRTQQKELIRRQGSSCDCGAPNRRTRIVGGQPTQIGEYPWMVAICRDSANTFKVNDKGYLVPLRLRVCDASLISHRWLLSAAHCFTKVKVSKLIADLGDYDLSTDKEAVNISIAIRRIIAHPSYSAKTKANDIALLELESPVTFTNNIRPICIPPPNLNCSSQQVEVTGWGLTSIHGSNKSVLRGVSFPVISNGLCKARFTGSDVVIDDSFICIMSQHNITHHPWQGDLGYPVAMMCDGRYLLAGISARGIPNMNYPMIYANVSFYRSWIIENTGNETCGHDCSPPPPPPINPETNSPTGKYSSTGNCECGAPNRRTRIVGGQPTQIGEYPWMVSIFVDRTVKMTVYGFYRRSLVKRRSHTCGASLISNRWLLSAAHCYINIQPSQVFANLGDHDITTGTEAKNKFINIKTIIAHLHYNSQAVLNDIALLELESPVTFTNNIRPICIPPPNLDCTGQQVELAGWGDLKYGGTLSNILRGVSLQVISNAVCKHNYTFVENTIIDDSVICTKSKGSIPQESCQGDSGGPAAMMCNRRLC